MARNVRTHLRRFFFVLFFYAPPALAEVGHIAFRHGVTSVRAYVTFVISVSQMSQVDLQDYMHVLHSHLRPRFSSYSLGYFPTN